MEQKMIFKENEEGKILFIDQEERELSHPEWYAEYPFLAEFSYSGEWGEVHGETGSFRLERRGRDTLFFLSYDGCVRVIVRRKRDGDVVSQTAEIVNLGAERLCVKKLSNQFAGICVSAMEDDYLSRVEIGVVRGEWGGEGQFRFTNAEELGLYRPTGHKTGCVGEISSSASYTTRKWTPLVFFRDKKNGTVWGVQHLPDGPYSLEIGLTDAENVQGSAYKIACGAGDSEKHGFRLYLNRGESYVCSETLFVCAENFQTAVDLLTAYRREYLARGPLPPLMFNDYMNCLWCKLGEEECLSLLDTAQSLGAEGYCFDDGWYRPADGNPADWLGDWIPCDERFGGRTFAQMIGEITRRGMVAGVWTELEVCSERAQISRFPKNWFLTNEGERIFRCGRYYFDFGNEEVCDYLLGKVRMLYGMGVRYIKNDYNGHPGCGVDCPGASPYAGLEKHCRNVNAFYARIAKEFPDLFLENCASGAMRSDGNIMRRFHTQSISDCEEYEKMPSILNGALLGLLPEQLSVWCYPYPRIFWEMNGEDYLTEEYRNSMRDGEQTAFNLINGFMGTMLLSGKLDRADAKNLSLIREAIGLYKEWRPFIARSTPFFPLGWGRLTDKSGYLAQGLRRENRALLAVWRRDAESPLVRISLPGAVTARVIFSAGGVAANCESEGVNLLYSANRSAALLEILFKS